jgi:hypothetical protein
MFSSVDPSLASGENAPNLHVTGGFRYDFTGEQAASCMHFQEQNRLFRIFENRLIMVFEERY